MTRGPRSSEVLPVSVVAGLRPADRRGRRRGAGARSYVVGGRRRGERRHGHHGHGDRRRALRLRALGARGFKDGGGTATRPRRHAAWRVVIVGHVGECELREGVTLGEGVGIGVDVGTGGDSLVRSGGDEVKELAQGDRAVAVEICTRTEQSSRRDCEDAVMARSLRAHLDARAARASPTD